MRTVDALPHTPEAHFRLQFFGAVLALRERLPIDLQDAGFLGAYAAEAGARSSAEWDAAVTAWAAAAPHLPLVRLAADAGLDPAAIRLLFTAGLVDEDARFGVVWEALEGPGRSRPTAGLLETWEPDGSARAAERLLLRLGLLEADDAEGPRGAWTLRPPALLWEALRGELDPEPVPWLRIEAHAELPTLAELILDDRAATGAARLPTALRSGDLRSVVVRGHERSGRRTLLGALARELGLGVLHVAPADAQWRLLGPLATLTGSLPVCVFELAPGETAEVDLPTAYAGPVGLALGKQGGLTGSAAESAVGIELAMPDEAARLRHWRAETGDAGEAVAAFAARARMTPGNVRRVAWLARANASVARRSTIEPDDLRDASRALHGRLLDTLAERVDTISSWTRIALPDETAHELMLLEARCRHRERLADGVGDALRSLTPGVRALFTGPSGTGKTLAAAILAAELGVDLYRLDLSTVVNKYLGETEKNLARVFARAEEADIALLLDEGDALLTQRTAVTTANDRYANLETNYLLQRLESFEGILIVTTNAGDRIDSAFRRRMDVVVDFRLPDATERWAIWTLHLPALHAVEAATLDEIVARCELSGGQIRNATLHASLLALDAGEPIRGAHVLAAVEREYRKSGEVCPLRVGELAYG
ncbi:MAG TPA: ATP-binding protein [Gaiellaceae bacterium]